MTRSLLVASRRLRGASHWLAGASLVAMAVATGVTPAGAQSTPFGSMVGMQAGKVILPGGAVSQWSGANRPTIGTAADGRPLMTIEQTQQKALLDWEQFKLQTNEVLEFQQQSADWIAVNRVHGAAAAEVNGEIRAKGRVFIFNDNGVLIGPNAKINTRQLVTGQGVSDVLLDGATTTIVQSRERATLNWTDMSMAAGQVLKFQQEKKDWIALNRSMTPGVTTLAGSIEAPGNIYLVAPQGLAINGSVKAQQVIASSLNIGDDQFAVGLNSYARDYNNRLDPTFSNTWIYNWGYSTESYKNLAKDLPVVVDPNDPLRYNVTVGRSGSIETGQFGKVMLFGPRVTNQGRIKVVDEGQVVLAAGENIYLNTAPGGQANVSVGAYNPLAFLRANIAYSGPSNVVSDVGWQNFYLKLTGVQYAIGDVVPYAVISSLTSGGKIESFLNNLQYERARDVGYVASNEGVITSLRGGEVDFRGLNLNQMGSIEMTSTALFRGKINFATIVRDYREYPNGDMDGPDVPGHGVVTFGKGSLTQITPDLDSTDSIPVGSGSQSVGSLKINAAQVHLQEDSLIYMPSGKVNILLDAAGNLYDNNRGQGANQDNEDGTRFMMDRGATIDLSGWRNTVLAMGSNRVTGKLFAAQLSDSPLQRDGALYRQEISVDRRYGTNLAAWSSFDNLSQGTLAQFLTDGGSFTLDVDDDFIMKPGSVIDVSGGLTTYEAGYVYTTLLRRLDGSIIDIREADPDELYMGLANQWTQYDTKWGKSQTFYIPLISSLQGKYETSYVQGGAGGKIEILAPDAVLQGTVKGAVTAGRYQRANLPKGGSFILNKAGIDEGEYVSNNVLISAIETMLPDSFGLFDKLSDVYGDQFGEEFDRDEDKPNRGVRTFDNTTLTSDDFFNRSTMGSYSLSQANRVDGLHNPFPALDGTAVVVESGVNLNLANGASFALNAEERMQFFGSIRTEGGAVSLSGMSLEFAKDTRLDTRGSWYSDYEVLEPVSSDTLPRINGGAITLWAGGNSLLAPVDDVRMILPDTMVIDSSAGAWVNRQGKLTLGKGGNLSVTAGLLDAQDLDLSGLDHARAYGLGGNGGFSLALETPIYIGDALPAPETPVDPADPEPNIRLLSSAFFSHSGFSSITLQAPSITVGENVRVDATTASLRLKEGTLLDPAPPAFWAPSGTDVYDIAEPVYMAPELRSSALRRGMDITFNGGTAVLEGASVSTEVGGKLTIGGSANIQGTLNAPAGQITLSGGDTSSVVLGKNARLLAQGVALITKRGLTKDGRATVSGEVLPGGQISINAGKVVFEAGAVLDVSGASAAFDFTTNALGTVVLQPQTVASDAGSISIAGDAMDINSATYRAFAGGPGARGGSFSVSWGGRYGPPGGPPPGRTAAQVVDDLEFYFQQGYVYDVNFNVLTTPYGVDLSTVLWEWLTGFPIPFPAGTTVSNRAELLKTFNDYTVAAYGPPPVFMIGDNLPPPITGAPPTMPTLDPSLEALFVAFGYVPPAPVAEPAASVRLSTARIADGGFSSFQVAASPGVVFVGDATLGGKKADGSFVFDSISIDTPRIMGQAGANVRLEAGVVRLSGGGASNGDFGDTSIYDIALANMDVRRLSADTRLSIAADTLLQIQGAEFYGFSDTLLASQGDIRLVGQASQPINGVYAAPASSVSSPGKISFKADQLYVATGHKVDVTSEDTIRILPQDAGTPLNGSPYEAAAQLTLTAPNIIQGGIVRSPLGTINLVAVDGPAGPGSVVLAAGSITSTSGDGHVIPYGFVSNGDTWIDPYTKLELTVLPAKSVNISGQSVDLQEGAVIDVSGGGDLYAREFVAGIGGTTDWLTGYRDADYKWVSSPDQIFAVLPSFEGDIAPYGLTGGGGLGVGDKIYLAGGSGLKAGYYTLLPAEFALLPGGFRVTANHGHTDLNVMMPGQHVDLADGSSIQSGYRYTEGTPYRDTVNHGFMVMNGDTLRMRSQYNEITANGFFTSEAFLKKALRTNRPIGDVPRIPLDGGSVVLKAARSLNLDATLKSAAAEGGRGGFADIDASRIVVVGANSDLTKYAGYLVLDSDRLNSFGAESLLLGGTRRQGEQSLELAISGQDVVIDNTGSVLKGPELLFAARDKVTVENGSVIETSGKISGSSGDLRILPAFDKVVDPGQPWDPNDDVTVNAALDQGAVLRLSSGEQVSVLRNTAAIDAMSALRADPVALAAANAKRVAMGLSPIVPAGNLVIADGAVLRSSRSIVLDATMDTQLSRQATLDAAQISAAASRISIGAAPIGTAGLVFAGGSAEALASATDLTLKSYSTIDIYGGATLKAADGLRLDSREIRLLNANGATATIAGQSVTLANTADASATAPTIGTGKLLIDATNIYLEGGDKRISGVDLVTLRAGQRVIGRETGTLFLPGDLVVEAANFTVESGGQTFLDAVGAVTIANNGRTDLPPMTTFGATLGFTGNTVTNTGRILLTGGTVNLRARGGDVVLADSSSIDVTSSVSQIFDTLVGVGAGTINLTSDHGDVRMATGAVVDVSGTTAGGDAGRLNIAAGQGQADMRGQMKGASHGGAQSGSFSMVASQIADFSAFNAALDSGGFMQSRRFEVSQGDLDVTGTIRVQNFSAIANQGSINVTGVVRTTGDSGGRIQISATDNVNLAAGSQLLAKANAADGSGGTVFLETTGRNGGQVSVAAGSLIDVSGTGEGGRLVRLRAPQLAGGDVAIAPVQGSILGARQVIAEGFKVYDNVSTIDQSVINTVSADANAFMANAAAIRARLGSGVTVQPGIELRSAGDMTLATDWDLHTLRFNGAAGVLTLRAAGDLLLNANLSDGFDRAGADATLVGGASWTLNLAAGANIISPDSLAVLPVGQLATGKGSVIVGGTPDTIEYYRVEITSGPRAGTTENRLYVRNGDGTVGPELSRDAATGQYVDPDSGALIAFDPTTNDYVDTQRYARVALPEYFAVNNGGGQGVPWDQYGNGEPSQITQYGQSRGVQWDNSTGYIVRTGTAGINIGSGRDIVLQYKPSVIYTAGDYAAPVADFAAPTRLPLDASAGLWGPMSGYYLQGGGDILMKAGGDIVGAGSDQLPNAWLWRYGNVNTVGDFKTPDLMGFKDLGRDYDQTTWFVRFDRYQAGIGALGGGNVDISAAGDITNLTVNLPNTGRVSGGHDGLAKVLHTDGGGNLSIFAGGNIGTGNFYVAEGQAQITAGGAFTTTRQIDAIRSSGYGVNQSRGYDLYTMLFTSSGDFHLQSGGDLNIDAVLDPLALAPVMNNQLGGGGVFGVGGYQQHQGDDRDRELYGAAFFSYTPDAKIALFSAGGDVNLWNNYGNIGIVAWKGGFIQPQHNFVTPYGYTIGDAGQVPAVWPGTLSAVAAAGDVVVKGGLYLAPSPTGNLELLAHNDVRLGQGTRADDPFAELNRDAQNFFPGYEGIFMSQSLLELMPSATNVRMLYGSAAPQGLLEQAGFKPGGSVSQTQLFTPTYRPDLHEGDTNPAKIYAAVGDVVTTAPINLPKALLVQAGDNVYFPNFQLQHNNATDYSLVRAGNGLYFSNAGQIAITGPGRLEVETGHDFYMPSNGKGITSGRVLVYADGLAGNQAPPPPSPLDPNATAADIAISTGFNQTPSYQAFEDAYLNPEKAGGMADFLLDDAGDGRKLSYYLFDRVYNRGGDPKSQPMTPELRAGFVNYVRGLQGLKPLDTQIEQTAYVATAWSFWADLPLDQKTPFDAFLPRGPGVKALRAENYLPETHEGLVNYVRQLQGLDPLDSQAEQLAYLDTAWSYWSTLSNDRKTPFYRDVLFLELRTTGREANAPDNPRSGSSFRGYDAIKALFPGAEKPDGTALGAGESRWAGDFETYASRVISSGGGKIEFVSPGGGFKLANSAAKPGDTGQPAFEGDRGNALRAGVVTTDGGGINIFARQSVTLNQSRVMTTKGGNILIWSSYGDIAAGKGAKTSVTAPFYDYNIDGWERMNRVQAGLPTGAGIQTVASVAGSPVADVDLIAPNGVVDAGDAGITVSGNFNVFAIEILGADNIDVSGIATGLPTPPAAAPISLDNLSSKSNDVEKAIEMAVNGIRQNAAIVSPSIIEVQVTGFGDCQSQDAACAPPAKPEQISQETVTGRFVTPMRVAFDDRPAPPKPQDFDIAPQPLADAVRAVGRASGVNILYDADTFAQRRSSPVRGRMTPEQALEQLLMDQHVTAMRVGAGTIVLRRARPGMTG
ncbi:filamentous haemagglutinin family protein [Caulobacter soli]|uniref:filamentous haemagglutinin family protein n=1 Tax=Caulobacter soli TaxID=2708539 RepID=UPI0013EB109B|nr:filamentous haemagglutinin family protein [Caulobacter soli]